MKFNPLSSEEIESSTKFRVYFNYVISIGNELKNTHYSECGYAKEIILSRSYQKIASKKN